MVNKTKVIPMVFCANKFGSDILARRTELGLTCRDIASCVSVHETTISKYERGIEQSPKMDNFLSLCNLFDLDPRNYFELEY